MQPVANPPKLHILVCTNQRPSEQPLPCCAEGDAVAIFEQLHRHVLANGWARDVYVTQTGCMAWCNAEGATVVIHPLGLWLHRVVREDVPRILNEVVAPLLAELEASRAG